MPFMGSHRVGHDWSDLAAAAAAAAMFHYMYILHWVYWFVSFLKKLFTWLRRVLVAIHRIPVVEHWLSSCGACTELLCGVRDLNSLTRDPTCIPWIARQIFNHWTTMQFPPFVSWWTFGLLFSAFEQKTVVYGHSWRKMFGGLREWAGV